MASKLIYNSIRRIIEYKKYKEITKKLKDNHELPFVPYLGISALIALFTKMDASTIEKMLNFFGI